jgi:beta-phosphoglucomutase-like phosphatase (HAD superfamily)
MKLSSVGLSDFFSKEYRITEIDAGFPKPNPAMYELAVKRLKLEAKECIAFEETSAGIASAKGANLFVIALPNKFTVNQDFSEADIIIKGGWPEFLKNPFSYLNNLDLPII